MAAWICPASAGTKTEYADVVELVDSLDLDDVTSGKVYLSPPARKIEYADMAELVDVLDLGDVTSGKVFHYTAGKVKGMFTCFYKSWIKRNAPPRIPLRV